jgi:hypothetical protein
METMGRGKGKKSRREDGGREIKGRIRYKIHV